MRKEFVVVGKVLFITEKVMFGSSEHIQYICYKKIYSFARCQVLGNSKDDIIVFGNRLHSDTK